MRNPGPVQPLLLLEREVHLFRDDIDLLDRLYAAERERGYLASWQTFAGEILARAAREERDARIHD